MVNNRIEALIQYFSNGNKSLFSKEIGVSPSVIGNITGERKGNPSFEVVQKILNAFASINPDWLMLGRGSMLREDQPSNQTTLSVQSADNSFLLNMYKEERAKSDAQAEEIGALKQQVKTLEKQLEDLGFGETRQQEASAGSIQTRKSGVAESENAQFAGQH